jgi:hypothetical protein
VKPSGDAAGDVAGAAVSAVAVSAAATNAARLALPLMRMSLPPEVPAARCGHDRRFGEPELDVTLAGQTVQRTFASDVTTADSPVGASIEVLMYAGVSVRMLNVMLLPRWLSFRHGRESR